MSLNHLTTANTQLLDVKTNDLYVEGVLYADNIVSKQIKTTYDIPYYEGWVTTTTNLEATPINFTSVEARQALIVNETYGRFSYSFRTDTVITDTPSAYTARFFIEYPPGYPPNTARRPIVNIWANGYGTGYPALPDPLFYSHNEGPVNLAGKAGFWVHIASPNNVWTTSTYVYEVSVDVEYYVDQPLSLTDLRPFDSKFRTGKIESDAPKPHEKMISKTEEEEAKTEKK